jgi:hypothetical protein
MITVKRGEKILKEGQLKLAEDEKVMILSNDGRDQMVLPSFLNSNLSDSRRIFTSLSVIVSGKVFTQLQSSGISSSQS